MQNDKTSLLHKLAAIQLELKAPKNQRNNFGGYNYRSAEDILEAVKPLAIKNGALVVIQDEVVPVGNRVYVKAEVRLYDICDNASIYLTTTAYAREEESKKGMDGSQITGAASSYARKYALNGMFAIDDTKDSDATNDHGRSQVETRKTASDILTQPKKQDVNPKYKQAWKEFVSIPANASIEKDKLAENFKQLCVKATNKQNIKEYNDEDWDFILGQIDILKVM